MATTQVSISSLVEFYSARFGIPADLSIEQMLAESSGNPNAVSKEGARGLYQVMPATAADLMFQPEVNIMVSRFFLNQLYENLKSLGKGITAADRWKFSLASYNAGAGTVDRARWSAQQDHFDADDYAAVEKYLPFETRDYVRKIWSGYVQHINPQA